MNSKTKFQSSPEENLTGILQKKSAHGKNKVSLKLPRLTFPEGIEQFASALEKVLTQMDPKQTSQQQISGIP